MSILLNLLPWRYRARQRRLRFLAAVAASALILLAVLSCGGKAILSQKSIRLQIEGRELEIELGRLQALLRHEPPEDSARRQAVENSALRITRWADWLPALSQALPADSWLSALSWHAGLLTIEGYASTLADLEHIESGLRAIYPDFHVKPGPISCDSERGLAYAFFVKEAGE